MEAKSIKGKSTEEIHSALTQSMSDGLEPKLAIVLALQEVLLECIT